MNTLSRLNEIWDEYGYEGCEAIGRVVEDERGYWLQWWPIDDEDAEDYLYCDALGPDADEAKNSLLVIADGWNPPITRHMVRASLLLASAFGEAA